MANVSSSNGLEKYPKLRFPQFSNAYTKAVLGDVFEYERPDAYIVSSEQYSDIYPTSVLTANQAFILGYTNEEHGIYNKGEVILFDDFTCDTKFANFPFKVKSSAMKLLRTKNGIPISYAYELLRYINYKPEGHARHWISIMQPLEVWLPQIDEQMKVGEFLAKITEKIDKQKSLIELLKKYKRGVSDQLFEQVKGISTQLAFSSVFVLLQNNTFSRDLLTTEKTEIQNIHYGDVLIKYGSSVNADSDEIPYIKNDAEIGRFEHNSYLVSGDIVLADTAEDYTVGKATEIINLTNKKILSGLHTIPCRPIMSFAPMFLGYYLNSSSFRKQLIPLIQGTKVSSIGKAQLMKTTLHIPPLDDQKRIANLLHTLDIKINLLTATVEQMKLLKSAMIQQLFI